jgi:hypothetical protein
MSANPHRKALSVAFVGRPHRRKLWLAPVVLLVLSVGATAQPSVAVLDIRATVGGAPADLGVTAARQVAAALTGTDKYRVADQDLVRAEVAKRGLRPPFGVGHLQLLADALQVESVVHGAVRSLVFDTQQRSATVVLSLELVDGATGNLRKRAEASGSATMGSGVDQAAAVVAAVTDAAGKAVEAVTGHKVQSEAPRVTVPSAGETPAAPAPAEGGEAVASGPGAARLPAATEGGESVPRTTTPAADLVPGAPPKPESHISITVVQRPPTGTTSAPAGGETEPSGGSAAGLPEPPEAEVLVEEGYDESLPPLVTVKILAKIGADRVLVTLGKGAAVTPRMELEVFRVTVDREETMTRRRLGRIRVMRINPTDAEARVLEGGPLMATGDYAYYFGP